MLPTPVTDMSLVPSGSRKRIAAMFPHKPHWLLAAALVLISAGCASVPANLERVRALTEAHKWRLGASAEDLLWRATFSKDLENRNHSLALFIKSWKAIYGDQAEGTLEVTGPNGTVTPFHVRFEGGTHAQEHGAYPLAYFDEIRPAVDYRVSKIAHHRRDGVGAPLVAVRENRKQDPIEVFYPPEGITRALTAVMRAELHPESTSVVIELLCPLWSDQVEISGETRPLAADFSVPWAELLSRSGRLARSKFTDALRAMPLREPRLYLMEPYDPRKEPLILIHGLFSSTLLWAGLSNELWADEAIRNRYQIWQYLYNTSAPALYSGRLLSQQLHDLRKQVDPDGRDPAMQSTTVIAHSMGGIVTRRLITRPEDRFWDAAFTRPLNELQISVSDREALTEAFFWEPHRHIKRVVYVAVPHRGSYYADGFTGRLGRLLVKPPSRFQAFYDRISSSNPGAFSDAYAALGSGKMDSVDALSPRQPTLQILPQIPNSHAIHTHSIIGNRGFDGPVQESSDGVVEYWSSHLANADSKLIVDSDHSAVKHPDTVKEIKRILRLPPGSGG